MHGLGWPSERHRRSDDRSIARRRDLAALLTAGSTAPLCLATFPPLVVLLLQTEMSVDVLRSMLHGKT